LHLLHAMAWQISRVDGRLEVAGELAITDAASIWRTLNELARDPPPALDLDLSRTAVLDGAIMALLVDVRRRLAASGTRCEFVGVPARMQTLVQLHRDERAPIEPAPRRRGAIAILWSHLAGFGRRTYQLVSFTGAMTEALGQVARRPSRANWRALRPLIERAGADGVPIVVVLNLLVGAVMAFQSAQQLKLYGANIYVADIVGISVTRELAPLMTAIIMSGRSGAAFAAELGTMQVSEEIDALRTMGLAPVPYLVLPRLFALVAVAPVLTLLGDIVGIAGGLYVGVHQLDLSAESYLNELRSVLVFSDVWTGLLKSVAFAITIAVIGCHQGLAVTGAAAGVGRSTTATVVFCLFSIVVLDTVFTVLFRTVGL